MTNIHPLSLSITYCQFFHPLRNKGGKKTQKKTEKNRNVNPPTSPSPPPQLFGAIWYNLGSTRMLDCIAEHCHLAGPQVCDPSWLTCATAISSGPQPPAGVLRAAWSQSADLATNCLTTGGSFHYGIYSYGVPVFSDSSWAEKVVYGLFLGLMTLR